MRCSRASCLALFTFLADLVTGSPLSRKAGSISRLVAFGDEMSDNGNGSYAHGMTGNPPKVYGGYGTLTNGPVAVSYLADLLGAPLVDYAFGACCGGGKIGATIDSAYTPSDAGAPSVRDQITNHTNSGAPGVSRSMAIIWAGQNDLSKHTDAFWLQAPQKRRFRKQFCLYHCLERPEIDQCWSEEGRCVNIYPKHLAPVTKTHLCGTSTDCVRNWGGVIQQANAKLKSTLASMSTGNVKVVYYDSFGFLTGPMSNASANGFTQSLSYFCDGDPNDPNQKRDQCWNSKTMQLDATGFFWTNYVQPTTQVYKLMLADMLKTIKLAWGA